MMDGFFDFFGGCIHHAYLCEAHNLTASCKKTKLSNWDPSFTWKSHICESTGDDTLQHVMRA